MCTGIAIVTSELPDCILAEPDIARRIYRRGEQSEVRFHWRDGRPLLPVWSEGQLIIARWGNRTRRGPFPSTGWTWQTTVDAGHWSQWLAEPIAILASYGFEGGVWFKIRRGIQGVLVHGPEREPIAYMICESSTRYYKVMTRSERMPRLIDEVI